MMTIVVPARQFITTQVIAAALAIALSDFTEAP